MSNEIKIAEIKEGTPSSDRFTKRRRSYSSPEEIMGKKGQGESSDRDDILLSKINNMLDAKLAMFPTKEHFIAFENKLDLIITENENLKKEVLCLKEENRNIKKSIEAILRKSKAKNLIIGGLSGFKEGDNLVSIG
uniref:Uncharacterized protein n=1 Tax=Rhodnius prolixus TaxID=13249 RepID=T1HJ40_RHOPR